MSKYTELDVKIMKEQLASTQRLLEPLVNGSELAVDTSVSLKPADLDRAAADRDMLKAVNEADFTKPHGTFGKSYARMQEDQRARRDINATRRGHKRLMLGCLETAYRYTLKLRKEIRNAEA